MLILLAISFQVLGSVLQFSMDKYNIEFSDSNNDMEEEEDFLEEKLFETFPKSIHTFSASLKNLLPKHKSFILLTVYIQLNSPPPELA